MMRTRFAPSPTGYMHIGNLRTALFTYLLTRNMNGTFILRIEDTDQERTVDGALEIIYNTLKDAGFQWDEGPDVGGDYGPYIQTERRDTYAKYAKELIEKGGAYYCFCDKERLDKVRATCEAAKKPPMYDGLCRNLTPEQITAKLSENSQYVVRQKMPKSGTTSFDDAVFGRVTVENITLDDQILLKSDGLPTYNFANVIDDHLMAITHVIRGNEYLSSAPKYNLLYESFGWEVPTYVHVSPVMRDSSRKLSKRDGDASYQDFIDKGYIKEAIINYIALLGWSPSNEENEKFTLDELIQKFDIRGISKSPAIFDEAKLAWLSGEYIRAMSPEEFHQIALPWINVGTTCGRPLDTFAIANLLQPRCERLSDIPAQIDFFAALPAYSPELFTHKKMKTSAESAKPILAEVIKLFESIDEAEFTHDNLKAQITQLVEQLGIKNGQLLFPLRVALSGKEFTPGGGIEIAAILGKTETLSRLASAPL